ncbi:MAG: TRAP transporter small permease [Proteobacteria bacterium]|nr:TRAP transporter small permease [Pseudomonadota bacterium]MBU1715774.1 TRAP transporter small permease [Pseudomonadota bacterium]
MIHNVYRICSWLLRGLDRAEEVLICLLLSVMIVLSCLQIVLRLFFSGGFLWADPLVRHLVIWVGMFGAAAVTNRGKHIALDVISFLLPPKLLPWLRIVIDLFSATVCGVLVWAAIVFVRNEAMFGGRELLGIPSWGWNLVFPLAFTLITLRFLLGVGRELRRISGKQESLTVEESV